MDNLTKIVRTEISRQYKSVRQFSFAVDIPLSTINSALHNGIGGSSFDTVVQICKTLGIKALSDDNSFYLTDETQELLEQYDKLDDYGRHTIAAVMKVEYDRCTEISAPYNGRTGFTSVNIPVEGIALVAGIDRIFDMGRTTINITGDAACAVIVSKMEDRKAERTRGAVG